MAHRDLLTGFACFLAGVLLATPAAARHHRGSAEFEYFLLSLSWSPEHCATRVAGPDDLQCGTHRRYGFVVHGLWPQYEGGYPDSCASPSRLDHATIAEMLAIMPSPTLVRHEWRKHGTCSGLDAPTYFATVRKAFATVTIPTPYEKPTRSVRLRVPDIKRQFRTVNPAFGDDTLAVVCDHRYLREVQICLDRRLRPRRCGRDVRDRCHGEVIVAPVR